MGHKYAGKKQYCLDEYQWPAVSVLTMRGPRVSGAQGPQRVRPFALQPGQMLGGVLVSLCVKEDQNALLAYLTRCCKLRLEDVLRAICGC